MKKNQEFFKGKIGDTDHYVYNDQYDEYNDLPNDVEDLDESYFIDDYDEYDDFIGHGDFDEEPEGFLGKIVYKFNQFKYGDFSFGVSKDKDKKLLVIIMMILIMILFFWLFSKARVG